MKITRVWSMPNKNTFSIKPIYDLVYNILSFANVNIVCDPFVGKSPFADVCTFTNDLDLSIPAKSHNDALEFLKGIDDDICDLVLFDPPYSPRQVSECYKKLGKSVNMQTTQASYWGNLKKEIARITKIKGMVVSCGWNSGGIGMKFGFDIQEILLVPHGGWHNDTIITVERKIIL